MNNDAVCAIVVTHNRKELLRECLQSIFAQTRAVARVVVINNQSTDGTLELLGTHFPAARFPQIELVTLDRNVGGAGGFHEGLKRAASERPEWLWLMDDDTIPEPNALSELLAAHARFPEHNAPDLLASRVLWTDGTLHPMNVPWIKGEPAEELYAAAAAATLPLRTATFVSLLLRRSVVEQFGLPLKEYFLATDDVEYSGRILRERRGVLVPSSVVVHKTANRAGTLQSPPPKFYYYVRNSIWMFRFSSAFAGWQKARYIGRFVVSLGRYLQQPGAAAERFRAIARGVLDGLRSQPRTAR